MGYCVASGENLLWVIVWQVVGICYGLLRGRRWEFVMGYCVARGGKLLQTFRNNLLLIFTRVRLSRTVDKELLILAL
jgi:hypothetical protein